MKRSSRLRPTLLLLAAFLTALWPSPARAQSVEFSLAGNVHAPYTPSAQLQLAGFSTAAGTASLRLALGDALGIGLRYREAGSLASIGNLVLSLAADGSTRGRYQAAVSARGVLGPLAVRGRAAVSDGLPPLAPLEDGALPPLPLLGAGPALLSLEVGGSYRASRAAVVEANPVLLYRGGRFGAGLRGGVRLVRAAGGDDVGLLLHAFAEPGLERAAAALGVGYTLNRRRAPAWDASLWFGWGPDGPSPGLRLSGAERLPQGRFELALHLEPYRLDVLPYRAEVSYQRDVGEGELLLAALAGLAPQTQLGMRDLDWGMSLRVGYRLPLRP